MFVGYVRIWVGAGAAFLVLSAMAWGQKAEDSQSQPAPETAAVEATPPTEDVQPSQASSAEDAAPAEVRTPAQVSAEDVLREFQQDRPKAQPLLPQAAEDETIMRKPAGGGEKRIGRLRMPDGFFLVDRAGRLTRVDAWWVFTFVADNNPDASPEPPLKLLPNQMLERMIRDSQGGARSVEFVVSGEVTDFMAENYLLLRKLMRKREMGNLSK